ncbi:hypothetical protein AJ80_02089 [Polytolypa hystricis UAMH7299]|uniref:Major facilitator superfamily (MFS) profile domain-containing protein n=1 Tax=Polytolypa hystricis (strain UAMH7299) TaxID=1447883 RepID=A0A2B7YS10_POLH7|nr:hypothetical protein AJ80_02089 [Polytolypa hystricis UAMH7299]
MATGSVELPYQPPYAPSNREPDDESFTNFSRPFIVPVYDPEHSNSPFPSTAGSPPPSGFTSNDDASTRAFLRSMVPGHHAAIDRAVTGARRYGVDRSRAASRLGIGTRLRASSMSITPSEPSGTLPYQHLSYGQLKELRRITNPKGAKGPPNFCTNETSDFVPEPPDGGLVAWAHVAAGFIVCLNTQGLNMAFGVFQAYYEKLILKGNSPSKIAWIGSFQLFATFFLCLIAGPLVNKGYFRLCFHGGSVSLFAGLLLASFCKQWWQLFAVQGVMVGVAMGLVFSSGIMVISSYFASNLGIATGIAAAGSSIGGILFPLVVKHAVTEIGFGWTMRIIALINLVTMIPVNIIARERPGLKRAGPAGMDWTLFTDVPYLLIMAGMFFAFWGVFFGFYFMTTFGQDILKMSPDKSLNLLVVMNVANLFGRFIPNIISDACIGPVNTLIPTTFLSSILVFLWTGVTTETALFLIACFYGFAAAGIQSLYTATVFSFAGPDRANAGIRVGLIFAVIGIATLTGEPLGGQLIVLHDGKYLYAQLFSGISIAMGGLLFLGARFVKRGWRAERL